MNDDLLWTAFSQRMLSQAEWTHRMHLRVAWMHVTRWGFLEGFMRMRVGIIRLNTVHRVDETAVRGYHDTMTWCWLTLVAAALEEDKAAGRLAPDSEAFLAQHPGLLDKDLPSRFYSYDQLMGVRARATVQPPDLEPLPPVAT